MASSVVFFGGYFLCFVLILTQMGFFDAYQLTYLPSKLGLVFVFLTPIVQSFFIGYELLVVFLYICGREEDRDSNTVRLSTLIWVGYVLFGLVPSVIAIWGFVEDDDLDKGSVLGPNLLKGIICITPFVLLLLTNVIETSIDDDASEQRRERLWYMSLQITVDLFDVTEMLDVTLEAQEQENVISREYRIAITTVACFAYLLTSLQMEETKITKAGQTKTRFKTTLSRNVLQMVFVNCPFLFFRLILKSWKKETIFISKNVIGIIYSLWKICKLCAKTCASSDDNYDYSSLRINTELEEA